MKKNKNMSITGIMAKKFRPPANKSSRNKKFKSYSRLIL